MLSKKARFYMIGVIQFTNLIGSTPYKWDSKAKKVVFVNTSARKLRWIVNNVVYNIYLVFVLFRWIQLVGFSGVSPISAIAIGTLYVFCSYNFVPAIQYSILRNYGDHHLWLNNLLAIMDAVPCDCSTENTHLDCYKPMRGFIIAGSIVICLDTMSCFAKPITPFFVTSLLPDPMAMSALSLLPFVCFHLYMWIHQLATLYFYITIQLGYLTGTINVLNHLRFHEFNRHKESPGSILECYNSAITERSHVFINQFRQIRILQLCSNKIWSTTNILIEVVFIGGSCLGYFGGVKLDGARAVQQTSAAIFLTTALILLWKRMGQVYEISGEVLHSWVRLTSMGWFSRYFKSMRPIRVTIGGFLFADREIRLTLISIILDKTCSLLLSTS